MQKIAIVIPAYNEGNRFEKKAFIAYANTHPHVQFVFVNDGSTDNTLSLLHACVQACPTQCHVHSLPCNQGKAEAVRQGLLHALSFSVDTVAYWDADLATPLDSIDTLSTHLWQSQKKIILGSRVKLIGTNIQRSLGRHYAGRLFSTLASGLLRLSVYDTQCGAKLFAVTPQLKHALSQPFYVNWLFDVELLVRLRLVYHPAPLNDVCQEIPLQTWNDIAGSKVRYTDFFLEMIGLVKIYRYLKQSAYVTYFKNG